MRHSWLVDAKWLFGLACLASIVVAGGLYSLSKLTERDPATGIFTGVMATFAKEGEGSEEFDELQALAAANPDQDFTIEGVSLPVEGRELVGLSYGEAVDLVVARIADRLYTEGPNSVEQFFVDVPEADSEGSPGGEGEEFGLGPFSLLTQDSHDIVRRIFTFSLIPILILAVPLVFFSRRFGRLGSPGVVLAVGTAPFAALWFITEQATKNPGEDGMNASLAQALSPTAGDVSSAFLRLFIVGLVLVLVAVAAHISFALWHRLRPTPVPADGETAPFSEPEEQPEYAVDEGFATSGGGELPSIGPGGVPQA